MAHRSKTCLARTRSTDHQEHSLRNAKVMTAGQLRTVLDLVPEDALVIANFGTIDHETGWYLDVETGEVVFADYEDDGHPKKLLILTISRDEDE